MKKLLLLSVACLLLVGCGKTLSPMAKGFIRASTSTTVTLGIQKDKNALPYLKAATPIICSASSGTNFSPAEVVEALESSSAAELKTPTGVILMNSVLAIYETAYEQYGGTNLSYVRPYLEAVCAGMHDALDARGTRQAVKPQPHIK